MGINTFNPELSGTLLEDREPNPSYEYSFCFSYQGEMFRPTNKMSLLRRALQEKHLQDGKIFFMDSDVLISLAVFFFVIGALSDALDGKLARRQKKPSKFGAFLDPIADKFLVFIVLVSLTFNRDSVILFILL